MVRVGAATALTSSTGTSPRPPRRGGGARQRPILLIMISTNPRTHRSRAFTGAGDHRAPPQASTPAPAKLFEPQAIESTPAEHRRPSSRPLQRPARCQPLTPPTTMRTANVSAHGAAEAPHEVSEDNPEPKPGLGAPPEPGQARCRFDHIEHPVPARHGGTIEPQAVPVANDWQTRPPPHRAPASCNKVTPGTTSEAPRAPRRNGVSLTRKTRAPSTHARAPCVVAVLCQSCDRSKKVCQSFASVLRVEVTVCF